MSTAIAEQARTMMRVVVTRYGSEMPRGEYVGGGQPGECWTNAWQGEGAYCEGIVFAADGTPGGTHAWNLNLLGQVIERTPGYEHVGRYVGVVIARDGDLAEPTLDWEGPRTSIVETACVGIGPAATGAILAGLLTRDGTGPAVSLPPFAGLGNRAQRRAAKRRR